MSFASYRACLRRQMNRGAWTGAIVVLVAVLAGCPRPPGRGGVTTGSVEGQVRGPKGQPLANVAVVLGPHPPDGRVLVASTKTDAAGRYTMAGIPPGRYYVEAHGPAYAPASSELVVTVAAVARAELRLAALAALKGRIQDGHGTPVPLAHVLAFAVAEVGTPPLHEARSDGQGRFELRGLVAGMHRLLIEAPGLGTAAAGPVRAPDLEVVVILPGESRSITGVVTRDGRPSGGARVLLSGEAVSEMRTTDADATGRFAFAGLGPGTYALRAESGAMVSPVATKVVVEKTSTLHEADVALETGRYLRGRVVDEAGHALAGAEVRVDLIPATGLWSAVKADKEGAWTSPPLPPGKYQLRARLPGYAARRTTVMEIPRSPPVPPTATLPITLELVRAGRIAGRILSEGGVPVVGATVHDRPAELEELGVIWSPLPGAAAAAAWPTTGPVAARYRVGTHAAQSGADGRFTLTDVSPGRLLLEIVGTNSVPFRGKPLMLTPGQDRDLGTITLATAIPLGGRVLDAEDRPVVGARIVARAQGQGAGGPDGLYAVTDREGAFTLPLAAGDHTVTASLANQPPVQVVVQVRSGAPPAPLTLRLPRDLGVTTQIGARRRP